MERPIRVLLVEDHTIVREGLRALVDSTSVLEVVGEAGSGEEALAIAGELAPDVAVVDLNLPGLDGVETIERLHAAVPGIKVLVLSMYESPQHVRPAIRAGASGYIVKGAGLSDFLAAVRTVAEGGAFFSPEVAGYVLPSGPEDDPSPSAPQLTPREREVLRLVAEGLSTNEIAEALGLSPKTIEGHRSRLISKIGVKNVAGLVRHAIHLGLVDPSP
ncbi:MAG: DNA-binding response regulator [Deltaproteobacteria bacterium]|nr:MAG: DNA-binding response regulator [Deltaproteobacteria bacterium]